MKKFQMAFQFLTRVGRGNAYDQELVGASMAWFPIIGLIIGSLLVMVYEATLKLFPPAIADIIAITFLIWFTRALHLDGFCDTVDGFYVGGENKAGSPRIRKKRISKVMKDPSVGSMASVALWVLLTLKFIALTSLDLQTSISGLLLMPVVSRWMIVMAARLCDYAWEEEGLGRLFVEQVSWTHFWDATGSAVLCLVLILGFTAGIQIGVFLVTAALGLIVLINRRIGGMTGDTLGAVCEISEVLFLLSLVFVYS
ncbi:MAG: adenosylcobinamide-GDP ribazoletransferase [bacterium]